VNGVVAAFPDRPGDGAMLLSFISSAPFAPNVEYTPLIGLLDKCQHLWYDMLALIPYEC